MVGWSWQGYSLGGLLLLSLLQSASADAACPPAVVPQNPSQPHYQNTTGGGVTGFVTAFVQSFLNTVQPNPFPQGQCQGYLPGIKEVLNPKLCVIIWLSHDLCGSDFLMSEGKGHSSNHFSITDKTGLVNDG